MGVKVEDMAGRIGELMGGRQTGRGLSASGFWLSGRRDDCAFNHELPREAPVNSSRHFIVNTKARSRKPKIFRGTSRWRETGASPLLAHQFPRGGQQDVEAGAAGV